MARVNPVSARATPPGATLRDELVSRGWTQERFASVIGRPRQFVSELVSGKRNLTPDTALRLEAALDVPASFWLQREVNYRLWLARRGPSDADSIRSRAAMIAG